jgi:chaperone required for assembly of F1-ATPase
VKRFWKRAEAVLHDEGWGLVLDEKPLRTPARALLAVPTERLAMAIAEEWNAVGETVEPRGLPLTGLANAAIDRIAVDRDAFAANLSNYAQGDLTCYRADSPRELAERQSAKWDPVLAWARRRFDVDFVTTGGLMHVDQPEATVERLTHALAVLDPFTLAGLSPLITIGGSLLTALAVLEGTMSADEGWAVVTVDDRWQLDQWGSDREAEVALENRRRDFFAAARFLGLLTP